MIIAEKMMVRHRKGGLYTILAIGNHSETNEKVVVYKSLKDGKVWARPYDMFVDGRFSVVEPVIPGNCDTVI